MVEEDLLSVREPVRCGFVLISDALPLFSPTFLSRFGQALRSLLNLSQAVVFRLAARARSGRHHLARI
jgi:hypothetical protein